MTGYRSYLASPHPSSDDWSPFTPGFTPFITWQWLVAVDTWFHPNLITTGHRSHLASPHPLPDNDWSPFTPGFTPNHDLIMTGHRSHLASPHPWPDNDWSPFTPGIIPSITNNDWSPFTPGFTPFITWYWLVTVHTWIHPNHYLIMTGHCSHLASSNNTITRWWLVTV